jgi:non-ribosomal peptide synthetase component F
MSTGLCSLMPAPAPHRKYLYTMLTRYFTGYGPAETAVSSSLSAPLTLDSSSSNIGPSYGARAWIVDVEDYNRLVPLGAAGELLLEGPQLARCYLNNNEMTAKAFVHSPRWAQAMTPGLKRRFYRTGDICRFNTDGTLSIMGMLSAPPMSSAAC